jgi:DNA (cytosine-5)-methyltransferase 1
MINVGSDFSGVGAFEQALIRIGIKHKTVFACDMDKYARQTYCLNFGTESDIKLSNQSMLIQNACLDLFSFNFPTDVYEREIPKYSLDIYMTSPPCQAFSLAGKRKGELDKRGILFYNSHEFIVKNKPRYFIFENVKGLLSDDNGKTFQRWIDYLAGKSINGNPVIFPLEEAAPYHVYYQVLNAKHYGVPQNRERIFIIGIRDDQDNDFSFPKPFPLEKRLKDVLESEVDEKYFLSDKMIDYFLSNTKNNKEKGNGFSFKPKTENDTANSVTTKSGSRMDDNFVETKIGTWRTHEDGKGFRPTEDNNCPTIPARAREDGSGQPVVKILGYTRDSKGNVVSRHEKDEAGTIHTSSGGGGNTDQFVIIPTNNSKGFDLAEEEEDSINFSNPNSETRRGRVGKKVSQTLDTACNQGIYTQQRIRRLTPLECFKLMDFNIGIEGTKDFVWNVSDSQAYKQAGNSIVVAKLVQILYKLIKP